MKAAGRTLAIVLSLVATATATATAPATARASSPPPPKARALTALDDARACVPVAGGGFAVATGGGLALVGRDGSTRTLTSLDGLPDTRVHAVVESPDGLWIGTEGGAALVSGGAVVRTVGSRPVHAVFAPSGGGAYLGTWGDGVVRLADKTAVPSLLATSASGKHVAAITEHLGALHVAYADGPVTRLEGSRLVAVGGSPTHGQALASVDGRLILGDVEGVFRLERKLPAAGDTDRDRMTSLASVDARSVARAGERALVVATYGSGLLASSPGRAHDAALHAEPGVPRWVRGVAVRGASRCAATTEGLFVDEGSGWHKVPLGGPPSNDVTTLAPSPSGDRVVVGTFDRGAAIFEAGVFQAVRGLEPDETVNAAAWQGEGASARLWLGTAHGLVQVDPRGANGAVVRRIRAADGLPSSIVRSLLVLPESGRVLVGTEEGAAFVEGDRVVALRADASSTKTGKAPEAKKGARPGIDSPMHATWALARDASGTIYLGTSTGLYYGDPKTGVFTRASIATSELTDDWVTALAVVPNGVRTDVLVGTYSGGVTRLAFEPASAKSRPTHSTHLGGGYINPAGLTVRGGELLASTMDGLLVRPLGDDAADWQQRLDASSGRDVTATRVVDGTLWVASRRGIALSPL